MASAFSHVAVPIALRIAVGKKVVSNRLLVLGMIYSIMPDLDSIAFSLGIPYESPWGHRGFSHSIFFAAVVSVLPGIFYRFFRSRFLVVYSVAFLSMISHGLLDALTTGGLGIAFFWPLNADRHFFPWQVIEVSPLSVQRFFTQKGISVLRSEFYYIWLPSLFVGLGLRFLGVFLLRNRDRKN
jgi:inner membrane protein